jgi:hypothetical protein
MIMKKRYSIIFLGIILTMLFQTSCLEDYLDQAPEAGLSEEAVFTKYENFKSYFNKVYTGSDNMNIKNGFSLFFNIWNQKCMIESFTDASDQGRLMLAQTIKGGTMGSNINMFTYDTGRRPILTAMFSCIRICNTVLQKIDMLQDANEEEKADFVAQAYFIRGFAHFTLLRWWGGMPYVNKVLGGDDQWDMPRLSNYETLMHIAADMDSALVYYKKAGMMRRDNPVSGGAGHLNNDNMFRPNGCAALGLKGRVLLYAASPQNNKNGKTDWENAAKANAEALETALQYGYFMHSQADYTLNWYGTYYTDEELWGYSYGNMSYSGWNDPWAIVNGIFCNNTWAASGAAPSQNMIDKFETKWGDPLNTEADRQAAIAAGHYNEQDPYSNRDPRFYTDIIYNTSPLAGYGTAKIYYERVNGTPVYSELLNQGYVGITHTGYYLRKLTGDMSVKNQVTPLLSDPIIRITELYLNYAEAANEAYGPQGKVDGFSMTAEQALNAVRNRMSMPGVLSKYTVNADAFRPRIKNERNVELCFEGHYYFDIRRWKDAPQVMSTSMIGMDIEKVPVSETYPTGYKYTRLPLPDNRQVKWKDAMYYLPFNSSEKNKMTLFQPNEEW